MILIEPIGMVRSPRMEAVDDDWDSVISFVDLDESRFTPESLRGLDQFSHIEIVYLFDRVDPADVHTTARHPRGNPDWPKVGIFAQRARSRPNRIGTSVCRLLDIDGLYLRVHALDAIDASPVLDIKPYLTQFAPRHPVHQPAWSTALMTDYWNRETDPT